MCITGGGGGDGGSPEHEEMCIAGRGRGGPTAADARYDRRIVASMRPCGSEVAI
jgi:hypothetical protein